MIEGEQSVPAYVQALLEQTADGLERMQRAIVESERERRGSADSTAELNRHLAKLTELLARDSRVTAELAETQNDLRNVLKQFAQANNVNLSDDLRSELRLMSRTIAAAMDGKRVAS